jgi:hypothetical protein
MKGVWVFIHLWSSVILLALLTFSSGTNAAIGADGTDAALRIDIENSVSCAGSNRNGDAEIGVDTNIYSINETDTGTGGTGAVARDKRITEENTESNTEEGTDTGGDPLGPLVLVPESVHFCAPRDLTVYNGAPDICPHELQ